MQLYWGDLHSHCSISYGQGTVEQALQRAAQQLDFCSITGHAFWPDMPTDRERYGEIIDYHREGFARLAGNWDELIAKQRDANDDRLVVFPSYEWHSLKYGDHNVYSRGPELALQDAPDLAALRQLAIDSGAIIIPHHIGYAAGYRGIDWQHFDSVASPLAEVYSLHGASISDEAPYPMLHDMGPRDYGSTAVAGWRMGHKFGVIGSSDHHGGYPGSHGDGRVGVWARSRTRDDIWDGLTARRTLAATGDRIDVWMSLNEQMLGSEVANADHRRVALVVVGLDEIDRVELLKNERVVARWHGADGEIDKDDHDGRLRVTWGWGRKDEVANWEVELSLSEGEIHDVETCFSGQAVVAPKGVAGHAADEDSVDLPHRITLREVRRVAWESATMGNRSTRDPSHQSLSVRLVAPPHALVTVKTRHGQWTHTIEELGLGGHSHYQQGWLSQAIRIGPWTPMRRCKVDASYEDARDLPEDIYRVRVAQTNGQCAWVSPIWVT